MSPDQTENRRLTVNRTDILRAVVADAESMGLRDREKIEWLTSRVIERLEQQTALPGMEGLVVEGKADQTPPPHRGRNPGDGGRDPRRTRAGRCPARANETGGKSNGRTHGSRRAKG